MKGRIVGFDFGTRKIGTATGNRLTATTQPLETVPCRGESPDWKRLAAIIDEWRADELVVGLPLHMDGSESALCAPAREFAQELAIRTGLPVAMVDERLSSAEADHLVGLGASPGKSRQRQREMHRDSVAAELIVRSFLAENPGP